MTAARAWGGALLILVCLCAPARAQIEAEFADEFDAQAASETKSEAEPEPEPEPVTELETVTVTAPEPEPATETVVVTESESEPEPEPVTDPDERRFRTHNTWHGAVGGIHVVDAGSGAPGTFRLQLGIDFFSTRDYLVPDDDHDSFGGTLSLSWTLGDYVEVFGAVSNHASSNSEEDPELLQVLGDALLGVKAYERPVDWLAIGGDFRVAVLNSVGDIGPVLSGTSFGFRAGASVDLRRTTTSVPLLGRVSFDYYFDNSAELVEDVEDARYDALGASARDRADEDRHLLRRTERFGLGINRVDTFTLGTGVEVPLSVARDFYVHPIVEWRLGVPVNRQGYDCLRVPTDGGTDDADSCLDQEGFSAMPSTLTLAARVLPPVRGLSLAVGIDVATGGASTFTRELAPNKPWDVLLVLAYAVDPEPPVREVEIVREVEVGAPPKTRIAGRVVEAGGETPIAGAIVAYPGTELTAQQVDDEGRFTSYGLDPGTVTLALRHDEFASGECVVEIPNVTPVPETVEARCELSPKPGGALRGEIIGNGGAPVTGATVRMNGPEEHTLVSDEAGVFALPSLKPGAYAAVVDAEGYLVGRATVNVAAGLTAAPRIELEAKKKGPAKVELTAEEVRIKEQIFFRVGSAQILKKSHELLLEIADVLNRNPQVRSVEIQGHTDSSGEPDFNLGLSQRRAESVRDWLVGAGVDAARLTAKGYGDTQPLVPNITARGRAQNRRVQFIVTGRD